ncbi:MAG: hypothetical protein Q8N81_08120 [bacterium]|nr:hypothetical protein [bacterium]
MAFDCNGSRLQHAVIARKPRFNRGDRGNLKDLPAGRDCPAIRRDPAEAATSPD